VEFFSVIDDAGDTRRRWVAEGKLLAADVRAELGTRATLVLGLWCSGGR
jgi:hypothetical protein